MILKRGSLYIASVVFFLLSLVVALLPEFYNGVLFLEIMSHYRLQITALLLIPFIFFIWRHYFLLASLQMICVVISLFFIMQGYPLSIASQTCSATSSLRVLSFNTYYMNPHYEDIVRAVENVDADIVLLLETQLGLYHHGHERFRKKYPFYYADIEKGVQQGKSFYSKYPIEALSIKKIGPISRGVLDAVLSIEGQKFNLMGIHAASPKSVGRIQSRNAHLAALSGHIRKAQKDHDYVILAGDFNATPWHSSMKRFKAETGLYNGTIYNILPTWPAWLPSFLNVPIDHIFFSRSFGNFKYYKGLSSGSDHYPIYVDLEWCK